jgi:hypothetical protein
MLVKLTRKLAERIDDVDVSNHQVGDVIDLSPSEAHLLLAEGWAELIREDAGEALGSEAPELGGAPPEPRAQAADRSKSPRRARPKGRPGRH